MTWLSGSQSVASVSDYIDRGFYERKRHWAQERGFGLRGVAKRDSGETLGGDTIRGFVILMSICWLVVVVVSCVVFNVSSHDVDRC